MKKSQLSSTLLWLCIVATALIVWRSRQLSSYLEKDRDNYMKAIKEAGKVLVKVKQELDVLNSKSEEALIDFTSVKEVDSQSSKPTPSSQDLATISSINKLKCLQQSKGVIFFYHARKAAGTTIRNILENYSSKYRMQLVESEGVVLMNKFPISSKNIFTITSLRHPIDRIISLYWYEHVAWYNEVKHDMSQCKSLSVWVNAWLDGSSWKQEFITKNSQSTYVEIENYFVKSLSGYVPTTTSIVTREHLEIAKSRLEEFDFIFITELMSDSLHMEAFKMLMEGRLYLKTSPITYQANKIDQLNVNQLQSSLAADEVISYLFIYPLCEGLIFDILIYMCCLSLHISFSNFKE
jgi:hypothetical protein